MRSAVLGPQVACRTSDDDVPWQASPGHASDSGDQTLADQALRNHLALAGGAAVGPVHAA